MGVLTLEPGLQLPSFAAGTLTGCDELRQLSLWHRPGPSLPQPSTSASSESQDPIRRGRLLEPPAGSRRLQELAESLALT